MSEAAEAFPARNGSRPDEGLAVSMRRDPEGVTVLVAGELDLSTAPKLAEVLVQLDRYNRDRLLLDLDAVEFIDSTGLGAVIEAQRRAERNGYQLKVRYRSGEQVDRLFELTGMADRLPRG